MSFGFGFSLPTLGWHLSGGGASSGYSVTKSLRFRSSASAYLNRTPAVAGNQSTWTWSGWVKRGALADGTLFSAGVSSQPYATIAFSSNQLVFDCINSGSTVVGRKYTNALYRDPSAWYHIVAVWDTTNGTAGNTMLLYVNGERVTSFALSTNPASSATTQVNSTAAHQLGQFLSAGSYYDGEMAEINFVDGQALAPTAFGASSIYNQWLPIQYAGAYGTNGFYLPFTNTASTSTLVADSSGNANNWTPNNISLTAGSTYDSLTDVPTLTSTTVANYAVLNPLSKTSAMVLSNANLTYTANATSYANTNATIQMPATGKWYFEAYINTLATYSLNPTQYDNIKIGISGSDGLYSIDATDSLGFANYSISTPLSAPYDPAGLGASNGGDTMMVAYDAATGKLWLGAKGSWSGGGNPSTGTTPTYTTIGTAGTYFPRAVVFEGSVGSANFGQRPFTYTAPTGFLPLNTFNI